MTAREFANKSIPFLYVLSGILMLATCVRLFMDFSPTIEIRPPSAPTVRAPFLAIPNVGPIARSNWIEKTLRSCLSFNAAEMQDTLNECSAQYFDVRARDSFMGAISRSPFGRLILENPNRVPEVQAINGAGPFMVYEGVQGGLPVWRYQTEVITTVFMGSQASTRRWLVDATIAFESPDALYFSGFRYISFYMKEGAS